MARIASKALDFDVGVKMIEIQQEVSRGFTIEAVEKLVKGWSVIDKYAYIVHDKDKKDDNTTPREEHIHLLMKYTSSAYISTIANRLEEVGLANINKEIKAFAEDSIIKINNLNHIKNWNAAVNYLTHRDEHKPNKYVYDPSEVHSNYDWTLDAEVAHQKKLRERNEDREAEIIDLIVSGKILGYQIPEKITAVEYNLYKNSIKNAFDYRNQALGTDSVRNLEVIFITGESGAGKDYYAHTLCKRRGLKYCRTNNGDNPFDNYLDEPAIIMSDSRDHKFPIEKFLNLIDNHYESRQAARYHDVSLHYCRLIIITSWCRLEEWYKKEIKKGEPVEQLYRRISYYIHVLPDKVEISARNKDKKFEVIAYDDNPFKPEELTYNTFESAKAIFGDGIRRTSNPYEQLSFDD